MATLIDTTPKIDLAIQDIEHFVEALRDYHGLYSPLFQRREQRQAAHTYLQGLLSELPRKSIEPMVLALEGVHPNAVRAMQAFISAGAWDDEALLSQHWKEVEKDLGEDEGVLLVDGSDFPKQGSPFGGGEAAVLRGVGQAGQLPGRCVSGLCQPARLYAAGSPPVSAPGMGRPTRPTPSGARRAGCRRRSPSPPSPMLGWAMIQAVVQAGTLRCRWVTCDEAFGRDTTLLDHMASLGLWYYAEVPHDTRCVGGARQRRCRRGRAGAADRARSAWERGNQRRTRW